ncbi:MAG: Rrf2 family transcriptional regulator [Candidatus Omnitrophica bacterium]|nr:Rrf2 family transcriptional regulator [Candidatus Omnitrophota bacterium]
MKLSTKSRYGTRLMLELAQRQAQGFILLGDIARSQKISEKYLWQLASALKAAGLVNAQRGVKGGFALAKPARDISVKDIVAVLEGPIELVDCQDCSREECITGEIWKESSRAIERVLASYNLFDLAAKADRMRAKNNNGYAAFGV